MTFLSKLYTYKQSAQRGAFEDFLTELLAEWLRLADRSGYSERALVMLFKLPAGQLPTGPITWSTQHVIPQGYGRSSRRKPDLAGSAPGFLFLVENKVSASFTSHFDESAGEETPQLDLYQSYLDQRIDRGIKEKGGLCLLTFATPPPLGWNGAICWWTELHHSIRADLSQGRIDPNSAFGYLTKQLIVFLEDHDMGSIDLRESDMVALPALRRLETAFGQMGALAVREASYALHASNSAGLIPCGGTIADRGDFRSPWFFGEVLTKNGEPFNSSAFVAWAGVMTADVDWISPVNPNIPEVSVGLALWCELPTFDGPDARSLEAFQASVASICPGDWNWQRLGRTENGPVMVFSSRILFTEAWHDAHAASWDDWAAKFFRAQLSALLAVLDAPYEGKTFGEVLDGWIHHP